MAAVRTIGLSSPWLDEREERLVADVLRSEREPSGPEHIGDELFLALVEPWAREPDRANGSHSYAAERDVSTTSSQWA